MKNIIIGGNKIPISQIVQITDTGFIIDKSGNLLNRCVEIVYKMLSSCDCKPDSAELRNHRKKFKSTTANDMIRFINTCWGDANLDKAFDQQTLADALRKKIEQL